MSEMNCSITLTVNGETVSETVEARKTLVDFLRDDLFLTGSHIGCEHGFCGACTVRVNGTIVRGCLMLAAQADGRVELVLQILDVRRTSIHGPYCRVWKWGLSILWSMGE